MVAVSVWPGVVYRESHAFKKRGAGPAGSLLAGVGHLVFSRRRVAGHGHPRDRATARSTRSTRRRRIIPMNEDICVSAC
jgi:hypothetical protein